MDKLKYIKLENEDGSYSNPIPLSVDGNYIDINGSTLIEELNKKANSFSVDNHITELKTEISSVVSGSPSGIYSTVAALSTADPDHKKIYLVIEDGHWYYYSNGWQDGGIYQSTSETGRVNNIENIMGLNEYSKTGEYNINHLIDIPFTFDVNKDKIYIRLNNVDKSLFTGFRIYGMKHETNNTPYTTLLDCYDKTWEDCCGITYCIKFNPEDAALYKRIRFFIRYSNETSMVDKVLFGYNDDGSIMASLGALSKASNFALTPASELVVTEDRWASIFNTDDLNDIYDCKIYFFNEITTKENLPMNPASGMFYSMRYNANLLPGVIQFFWTTSGDALYRMCTGAQDSFSWKPWRSITNSEYIPFKVASSNGIVLKDSNIDIYFPTKDFNDIKDYKIYYIYDLHIDNAPYENCEGIFYSMGYSLPSSNIQNGKIQLLYSSQGLYYRIFSGNQGQETWSVWKHLVLEENIEHLDKRLNHMTCKIFKKVVCCGDSYTSGYIKLGNQQSSTNEDYAWPHYMSTMTGNNWVNCGHSGSNAYTWLTNERGLPKAQASGRAQAYIIGLGINDSGVSDRHLNLGTIEDVGTETISYYGCYSKIIRELKIISPKAKIFVVTGPYRVEASYNQAVRNIAELYKDDYDVFLLDLANSGLYQQSSLVNDALNGHYSAIGYEQFAEIYAEIISDYINNHIEDFQDVAFIPYD